LAENHVINLDHPYVMMVPGCLACQGSHVARAVELIEQIVVMSRARPDARIRTMIARHA